MGSLPWPTPAWYQSLCEAHAKEPNTRYLPGKLPIVEMMQCPVPSRRLLRPCFGFRSAVASSRVPPPASMNTVIAEHGFHCPKLKALSGVIEPKGRTVDNGPFAAA